MGLRHSSEGLTEGLADFWFSCLHSDGLADVWFSRCVCVSVCRTLMRATMSTTGIQTLNLVTHSWMTTGKEKFLNRVPIHKLELTSDYIGQIQMQRSEVISFYCPGASCTKTCMDFLLKLCGRKNPNPDVSSLRKHAFTQISLYIPNERGRARARVSAPVSSLI